MKKCVWALVLTVVAGSLCAWAQRGKGADRIKVPFEFMVGTHVLPSGEYLVEEPEGTHTIVMIRSLNRTDQAGVFVSTSEFPSNHTGGRFVFASGGQYPVLRKILQAGARHGHLVLETE